MKDHVEISWKSLFFVVVALNVGVAGGYAAKAIFAETARMEQADSPPSSSDRTPGRGDGDLTPAVTAGNLPVCQESPNARGYVTPERLDQLRTLVASGDLQGLGDLDGEQGAIVAQVMESDPDETFFVARIARSLAIVDSMHAHVDCLEAGAGTCSVPADIAHFQRLTEIDGSLGKSWSELRDSWQEHLLTDIESARVCFGS